MLEAWDLIEADLQSEGVDVGDPELMANRSWRWLRTRISGLLAADTRTARYFRPEPSKDGTDGA